MLTNFLDVNGCERRKVLLMDAHNLIFRTAFVAVKEDPLDEEFIYWKHLFVQNILRAIEFHNPDVFVFAIDSNNYWRKDILAEYKQQRAGARQDSIIDFEKFFPILNDTLEDLQKCMSNAYFLRVERCEADDIIAVLTKDIFNDGCDIVNISTDSDMHQLLKYKYYKQYNPIKKEYAESLDSETSLLVKIITGDRSDNIPNISRKKGLGPVKARKYIENGLEDIMNDESLREGFEINKQLIDFECIPAHISSSIINELKSYKWSRYRADKMMSFIMKHKLTGVYEELQNNTGSLLKLKAFQ